MKLSSVAVLFGAAVAAFFPGASADSVSLRGTTPDEESFIDMINCSRKTTCEYAYGTCQIYHEQCQGVCVWVGTKQDGYCTGGSSRSCKNIWDIDSCHNNGCIWSNNACRYPSSSWPSPSSTCSNYNGSRKCLRKGCFWDGMTSTCNANIITRGCTSIWDIDSCHSDGCVWSNNACRNPSSPSIFKCSNYNRTNRNKCVNKGCVWDSMTSTCNANIITRSCRGFTTGSDCFSAGCDWRNGVCYNPSTSTSFQCSDFDSTNSNTCKSKGCVWDSVTNTCNAKIINRSNPTSTSSRSGDMDCTGPNSKQCDFMTEFCYTKGDCSANAPGMCQVKPKNYADCANSGIFSTYPTSAGNACGSTHFYNSECEAAQEGKNIPFTNEDEVAEEVEREESDSVFEEE